MVKVAICGRWRGSSYCSFRRLVYKKRLKDRYRRRGEVNVDAKIEALMELEKMCRGTKISRLSPTKRNFRTIQGLV
jgi:hypothetical protein